VEEQFYAIWPLILAATLLLVSDKKHRALLAIIIVISAASFAANILTVGSNQPKAFLGFFSRIWQLGTGAALATWLHSNSFGRYPGWWALFPPLSCAAVIAGGTGDTTTIPARILGCDPFQWIGARSYSLYLWHWPFIVFFGPLIAPAWLRDIVLLVLSVGVAAAAYRFVENPIRQHRFSPSRMVAVTAGIFAAGLSVAAGTLALPKMPATVASQKEERVNRLRKAQNDRGEAYTYKCHLGYDDIVTPNTCVFGAAPEKPRVVLFGDSHAVQWFNPIHASAQKKGWQFEVITKSGCPAMDVTIYFPPRRSVFHECDQWRKSAMATLTGPKKPDLVIIASRWTYSGWVHDRSRAAILHDAAATNALRDGFRRTLQQLKTAGVQIAVIIDTPSIDLDYNKCIIHGRDEACATPRSIALPKEPYEAPVLKELNIQTVLDFNSSICDETVCPALRDGQVLYQDPDHLTATYTSSFADHFKQLLSATGKIKR
jgi:SGNH domain (fused to AT3 domains)